MKPHEIRTKFLEFFKSKGHEIVNSDSIIPSKDPTLLFTTAGMVQFKSLYAGSPLTFKTAATVQKCLRAGGKDSDLEKVGKTLRHHTFFEMLGNFSFGDYFKREAIQYAKEFILDVLKMDKNKLFVSVFEDDDEAKQIWIENGFLEERIVKLGKRDNFWGPAGSEGACGPCSEIYYDLGIEYSCKKPDCAVGCDCERYLEFWNLVFPQFYQESDGTRKPLARRGVDTGMGLERISFLMDKNAKNNYETDVFKPIIEAIKNLTDKPYSDEYVSPYHVVADHIRALTFAIGDGVIPSNEGRGYVIRRILRRALRFGKKLNLNKPYLFELSEVVIDHMKCQYPELEKSKSMIQKIIKSEEERFIQTLNKGIVEIEAAVSLALKNKQSLLDGKSIFTLYDTFGLPLEIISEVAIDHNLTLDQIGFEKFMNEQKTKGKKSWRGTSFSLDSVEELLKDISGPTTFLGYDSDNTTAKVLFIINSDESIVVFDKTVFYAESGGQIYDTGKITWQNGNGVITNVQKSRAGIFLHTVKIESGALNVNDVVTLSVDNNRRSEIRKHHTATHILQYALRQVLGEHVKQAGSLVTNERLRFDFSHIQKLTSNELFQVEQLVNDIIIKNLEVNVLEMSLEKAKIQKDIIANFGEKYSEIVRLINVGNMSKELCGGIHISNTGFINGFKIISESSVSAGVRRIEALVGDSFIQFSLKQLEILNTLAQHLKIPTDKIIESVENQNIKIKELEKKLLQKAQNSSINPDIDLSFENNGIKIIILGFNNMNSTDLLNVNDNLKSQNNNVFIFLGSVYDNKITYISSRLGNDLIDCSKLLNEVSKTTAGKGGGQPSMARGGGKETSKFLDSLNESKKIIISMIEKK